MQGQVDEVPHSVIKHCFDWKELCNVSELVEVALQSLGTSIQMPIRTRLCCVRNSSLARGSVIRHVASLKVHRCHDSGKQCAKIMFRNTYLESPSESFAAANVLKCSSTFLVDIVSFSISLSTNAGDGPGERSLPSTMRLSLGVKGLPVSFSILSVIILPRQKGRSPMLLCCIEKTRNAFICSISSGTSLILFLLRSSISNCGRPKIFLSISFPFE